MTFSIVHR